MASSKLQTSLAILLAAGAFWIATPIHSSFSADLSVASVKAPLQQTVGTYSGSFDPPTLVHLQIIRNALKDYQLDQLHVFVNVDSGKNYKSASYERIAMLKAGLSDVLDRIDIRPISTDDKSVIIKNIEDTTLGTHYRFIGEDSYDSLPAEARSSDSKSHWVVFKRFSDQAPASSQSTQSSSNIEFRDVPSFAGVSSTKARDLLQQGLSTQGVLDPKVADYIRKHALYPSLPQELVEVQRHIQEQAFAKFQSDTAAVLPQLDLKSIPAPPFEAAQSPAGRAEAFIRWVVEQKQLKDEESKEFRKKATSLLFTRTGDELFPKIPYIAPANSNLSLSTEPKILSKVKINLPKVWKNDEPHTLDLNSYVQQRIPTALQSLINDKNIPVFAHDGNRADAIAYHQAQGFNQTYFINLGQGNPERQAVIVRNSETGQLAYVSSNLKSVDQLERAKEQLGLVLKAKQIQFIKHAKQAPLIEWSEIGKNLHFHPTDDVIIGFENWTLRNFYPSEEWKIESLSEGGLPIKLYTSLKTGRRIINSRNVYGDEMKELLRRLYHKGARRFFLLGTAGSLDPSIHVGDIVVPDRFYKNEKKWVPVRNDLDPILRRLPSSENIRSGIQHGWTQTVLKETVSKMEKLQSAGVQTLEIEGRYLIEFLNQNPKTSGGLAFIVSDEPMSKMDYSKLNVTRPKIDAALERISQVLYTHEALSLPFPSCFKNQLKESLLSAPSQTVPQISP